MTRKVAVSREKGNWEAGKRKEERRKENERERGKMGGEKEERGERGGGVRVVTVRWGA